MINTGLHKKTFIQVRHDTSVELSMSRSDSYQGLTVAREKSFFVAPFFFGGGVIFHCH